MNEKRPGTLEGVAAAGSVLTFTALIVIFAVIFGVIVYAIFS